HAGDGDFAERLGALLDWCDRLGLPPWTRAERAAIVPALVSAVEAGIEPLRCARLLAALGEPGFEALSALSAAERPELRLLAVQTLTHVSDVRARRALSRCTRDADPKVRQAARAALESLGTPEAPLLRISLLGHFQVERDGEIISDSDWKTRKAKLLFKYLVAYAG